MEVLQRTANRGSIATGAASYEIENSVKLQTSGVNSEFFNYNVSSTGSRTKGTVSMWIKRTSFGTVQYLWEQGDTNSNTGRLNARFQSDDTLILASSSTAFLVTNRVFRDASAWYHIVVAVDTTSGTADNRMRLYVNGVEETSFSTRNNPSQNQDTGLNFERQYIGSSTVSAALYETFNGYMAEVFGADGLVYAASDFGEFDSSGIWKPKDLTAIAISSSVGTNGFYMKFENAAGMGANSANSGHGFSVQNINQNDQATDVPSNNFCTLNPLWTFANTMGVSDGATNVNNTVIAWGGAKGSIGVNSGKWYWEHLAFNGNDTMFGIQNQAGGGNTQAYLDPYTLAIQANSNVIQFTDPSNRTEAFSKTFSVSDIWGVALDLDANTIAYYRNGSIVNSAFSIDGLIGNGEFFPFVTHYGSGLNSRVNFGGYVPAYLISSAASDENGYGTFEYAPPSGYYALCTKNLAEYG